MEYKRNLLLTITSWIHSVLLFTVIYPLIANIASISGDHFVQFSGIGILLFIPVIISWILVWKIKWLILYVFLALVLSTCCGYLGSLLGNVFSFGNLVSGCITSIISLVIFFIHAGSKLTYSELKQDYIAKYGNVKDFALEPWELTNILTAPSPSHWIWFFILYIIGIIANYPSFLKFLFWTVLLDIFLCFFYKFINGFHHFIRAKKNSANLPVTAMKRIHKVLIVILSLLLLLCMIPSILYGKEDLAGFIQLKNIPNQELLEEPLLDKTNNTNSYNEMMELLQMDEKKTPAWVTHVLDIATYLLAIASICIVLYLIYLFIKNASKVFRQDDEDEILFLDTDNKRNRMQDLFKSKPDDHYFSSNMKIRRRYKKTIRKATQGEPNTYATPTELEVRANLSDSKQIQSLHHLYEKARYSEDGCTEEDIKRLK